MFKLLVRVFFNPFLSMCTYVKVNACRKTACKLYKNSIKFIFQLIGLSKDRLGISMVQVSYNCRCTQVHAYSSVS